MREVVIVSGTRTPIGRFGGTLKDVSDMDIGALVIREALRRAGITGEQVDEVIFASGYRTGDLPINSARVVAVKGGIPIEKPQFTITKACGGSLRAVSLAAQIIKSGDADVIVAGGHGGHEPGGLSVEKCPLGISPGSWTTDGPTDPL